MNNENQKLPKGWMYVSLGELCVIERGGSPRPIKDFVTNDENGLNWIKIGDTKGVNKFIYHTAEKIKPEAIHKTRKVYVDDLILSNSMSFGRPYIMKTEGCIHDGWLVIRIPKGLIDTNYLYYILSSSFVYTQFSNLAKGSTVKNLNIEAVQQVFIYLPPLAEQHRIVAKIEELFSSLEKGVECLQTAQEQLKRYRQAVLKWAFEGRLTHKDLKQGELPKGWVWKKLGEVCKLRNGYAFKSSDYLKDSKNGIPIIRISDIGNGKVDLSNCVKIEEKVEYDNFIVFKDDILIAMSGATTGKFGIYKNDKKAYQNQRVGKFDIFAKEVLHHSFLFYLLYSLKDKMLNDAYGGAQPNISSAKIEGFSIPLPPLAEQEQIVSEIEKRLSVAEKVEESIRVALEKAERLRQSILKKAFEGKLVPQDENDEPASVLLEKIKRKNSIENKNNAKFG